MNKLSSIVLLLITVSSTWAGEMRTWRSKSGSEIEAKLGNYTPYSAVLETKDGKTVKIAPTDLSETDQAYLKAVALKDEIAQSSPDGLSAVAQKTYETKQIKLLKRVLDLQRNSPKEFFEAFVKDKWYIETGLAYHPVDINNLDWEKSFTVIQVVDDNTVLSSRRDETIAIKVPTKGMYEGYKFKMIAGPIGVYQYESVLGASRTIQLWGEPKTLTYEQFLQWSNAISLSIPMLKPKKSGNATI